MSTQIGITHREIAAAREIEGGSTTEAIGGAAAIVLGILGLLGMLPVVLASIATIAAGAALIAAGGSIAARYERALDLSFVESTGSRHEIAGGLGMEVVAGVAAVVLGILAILGRNPSTLLSVVPIVIGAGLLMASASMSRLESLVRWEYGRTSQPAIKDAVQASAGSEVIVGLGAVVLGILALVGYDPMTLVLVSILAIGASLLFSGSAVTTRFFSMFQ